MPFIVHTDACAHGLGAVLSQKTGDKERVIYYASRSLTDVEQRYAIWELEALAVVWALRVFRMWLYTSEFDIFTDSTAIARVMKGTGDGNADNHRITRWLLAIQAYNCKIYHRPGAKNGNADGLSRNPCESTCPYGEQEEEPLGGNIYAISSMTVAHTEPNTVLIPGREQHAQPRASKAKFENTDVDFEDMAQFTKLQGTDQACMRYRHRKSDPQKPTDIFSIEQGLLMIRKYQQDKLRTGGSPNHPNPALLVVPAALRADIIRRYHGLPICGHPGVQRTVDHIQKRFWWRTMHKDVKRWIRACLVCCKRKTPRPTHHGTPSSIRSTYPFHKVAVDLVEVQGKCIMSVLDLFTRYVTLVDIADKTAATIGNALFSRVFAILGIPAEMITDEGSEFVNTGVEAMCATWQLRHIPTTGYQPQANPVERYHRWMNSTMTSLRARFGSKWEDYLPGAAFAYNISTNTTTGFTPFFLMFGRESSIPDDIKFDLKGEEFASEESYGITASERMKAAYEMVIERQKAMSDNNRADRMEKAKSIKLNGRTKTNQGDYVLRWDPQTTAPIREGPKPPGKWCYRWSGPHEVILEEQPKPGHPDGNIYTILDARTGKEDTLHVNRLIRYHPWDDYTMSTSEDIDERPAWKQGGEIQMGEFCIFGLMGAYPYGVGRRIERGSILNGEDPTDIEFQWYGNPSYNMEQAIQPGWIPKAQDKVDNVQPGKVRYTDQPSAAHPTPYRGKHASVTLGMRDVIIHSFRLTPSGRIPAGVRRIIAHQLEAQKQI